MNNMIVSSKMPAFSVIMPTYNRAFCIKNAINSLLKQTYQKFELIIVDDGSADGTEQIVKHAYKKELENKKIKYIKLDHKGVCAARNAGIEEASNEWIAYLDTDNVLMSNALGIYALSITKNPKQQNFYGKFISKTTKEVYGKLFNIEDIKKQNTIDLGVYIHTKAFVLSTGLFDSTLTRLVDWDFIGRQCLVSMPKFIPEVLMVYNDSVNYNRISNSVDYQRNYARICQKLKSFEKEHAKISIAKIGTSENSQISKRTEAAKASDIFPITDVFPLVSVLITTRNRTNTACIAIKSLIDNIKYRNLKWIICDDQSNEGHIEKLTAIFKNANITNLTICKTTNDRNGLGASLNNGLKEAFKDSSIVLTVEDDWYLQRELFLHPFVKTLVKNNNVAAIRLAAVCCAKTCKSDIDGYVKVIAENKLNSIFNNQVALRHKRIYDELGMYLENCNSDSVEQDMNNRFLSVSSKFAVLFPENIKLYTLFDSSLFFIHFGDSGVGHNYPELAQAQNYVYSQVMQKTSKLQLTDESITVVLATFPPRKAGVPQAVEQLHDQCTQMIVCLNQYDSVPAEFPKYPNVDYVLAGPNKPIPDLGCNNKMAWLGKFPGYYITVDDDIIYPKDYCRTLVTHMKKFNNSVICSYEGRTYSIKNGKPITLDIHKCKAFSFMKGYTGYHILHRGGGGVMCMYPAKLPFNYKNYTSMPKNSGDDEITTILCQKYNIKMVRPPSSEKYLDMIEDQTFIQALHTNTKSVISRRNYMLAYDKWREAKMDIDLAFVRYKNLGDSVSDIVVNQISENIVNPVWILDKNRNPAIVTIGSIMHHVKNGDTVWGTGCISNDKKYYPTNITDLNVLCVRGPLTRNILLSQNIPCNEIYGDPGIFIPYAFNCNRANVELSRDVGIIPHVEEVDDLKKKITQSSKILIIDFRLDPAMCLRQIMKCRKIVSSSLHGIIIAETFGIPTAWLRCSDKIVGGKFKYHDYYLGSGRKTADIKYIDWRTSINLADIENDKMYLPKARYEVLKMLNSAPFIISQDKKTDILNWFKQHESI